MIRFHSIEQYLQRQPNSTPPQSKSTSSNSKEFDNIYSKALLSDTTNKPFEAILKEEEETTLSPRCDKIDFSSKPK